MCMPCCFTRVGTECAFWLTNVGSECVCHVDLPEWVLNVYVRC